MTEHRTTRETSRRTSRPRVPQLLTLAVGAGYLVLAVAGFVETGTSVFSRNPEYVVWGFGVSTLLNCLHAFVALVALYAARTLDSSQNFGWLATVAFTALTIYGFVADIGEGNGDPLNVNAADNWLHLATAGVAVVIGLLARRAAADRR